MSYYVKVSNYIDNNPYIVYNVKQFRALILDLTENDIPLTNLLVTSLIDELPFKISKLKKEQRSEINNLIHSFVIRYSIDPKCEDKLYEFYANVFAERIIPEQRKDDIDYLDPIINLNLKTVLLKEPPKVYKLYCCCGSNKQDFGFVIKGIEEKENCSNKYKSIFAIVLGLIQRSLIYRKSQYVNEFENKIKKEINLSNVFKLEITILELIKNNYFLDNELNISYDGDINDLQCAIYEINALCNIISKLANIKFEELTICSKEDVITISTSSKNADVYVSNAKERFSITRLQWNENSLKYKINKSNEKYLLDILKNIFLFEKFLPGQKECLISNLNNPENSYITILPVGGGKSLIFYFIAYLKSSPTFVVSPSNFLISDQLRNLKLFHDIDDAIQLSFDMNFKNFIPSNKLIYITPKAFLNRELICKLIKQNYQQKIGNIILDEVHCISNWGHDFKPEYLMLSYNLNEFLSNLSYSCYTGTANYKVIKDITCQLNIKLENVLCPIALKNNAFSFRFIKENSIEQLTSDIANQLNEDSKEEANKKTIIFAKQQLDGNSIYNSLSDKAKVDVDLSNGMYSSYHDFIKGNTNALICGEAFGIGINLPRINNIIHAGTPLSKSQYIQEIGRGARNKEISDSTIYYLSKDSYQGFNKQIIDKSIPTEKLVELYNKKAFTDEGNTIISKLFGNIEDKDIFTTNVISLMETIEKISKEGRISFKISEDKNFSLETARISRYLYVLFRVGYIYGWYFDTIDEKNLLVTYYVDPGKNKPTLDHVIYTAINYLSNMGDHKKAINEIKHSTKISSVIKSFINWYYTQLLYYHREQYIEMLDFVEKFSTKTNTIIRNEINHYFSLSLLSIESNSNNIKGLSINDIYSLAINESTKDLIETIKSSIENNYSNRLDLYILISSYIKYKQLDIERFDRILSNSTNEEISDIIVNYSSIYDTLNETNKIKSLNVMSKYYSLVNIIDYIYDSNNKDVVYYYIISKIANNSL